MIHKYIVFNLTDDGKPIEGGSYRNDNKRGIKGVNHPDWKDIQREIQDLITWYYERSISGVHPVELASIFHQKFEEIHPFYDGNGRTGRAILHYMLTSKKYPIIFFPPEQKEIYLDALRMGNTTNKKLPNYVPLLTLLIQRMYASLTYIVAKTSLLDKIRNSQKEWSKILPESLYSKIFDMIDVYHESDRVY